MGGNLTTILHSLNGGEVSPRMAARQDQNKYLASCERMRNWIPLVLGGARFRDGMAFGARAKVVDGHPEKILRPFVASRSAAYTEEFGHQYVRFYRHGLPVFAGSSTGGLDTVTKRLSMLGSGLPWEELLPIPDTVLSGEDRLLVLGAFSFATIGELVTPYADSDLANLFVGPQSIDVQYLLHSNYAVRKISRISQTEFIITQVNFDAPATLQEEPTGADIGAGDLTPAATTGTGITFTASDNTPGFLAADVGRVIVSGASRAVITTVTDAQHVDADIVDDFVDTAPIPADSWRLRGTPQSRLDVTNKRKQQGEVVTITAKELDTTSNLATFREADVGKYVTLFGGTVRIDTFTDSHTVKGTIKIELHDIDVDNPDPTPAWTMEVPAWSATLGFPSWGCFYEERLWLKKGLTLYGSRVNDFENFGKGSDADDSIVRTLSDDDLDAISWIKADKTLKVGTGSGIYEITPTTQNGALTPSSFKASQIDPNGAAPIAPIRVGGSMIYVDVSGREMRQLAYDFATDKYKSPQIFRYADHLMVGHFVKEGVQSTDPDNIIYVLRDDGAVLGLIYEEVEQVTGWFVLETAGEVKSICVIPRPETGKDWLQLLVERENGVFYEYVEPDFESPGREWHELKTDSAVITTHDVNFVVSGLDHLEGQSPWVIGDGMLFNFRRKNKEGELESTAVVTDGQLTLDPPIPVSKVEVGLPYVGTIVTLEPRLADVPGGPLIARSYAEVGAVVRRTGEGLRMRAYRPLLDAPGDDVIVGESLLLRKPWHPMDAPVPLQRGKLCINTVGQDCFARVELKQQLPFPAEVLNLVGRLHVGDKWCCDTYGDGEPFVEVNEDNALGYLAKECGHTCPLGQRASIVYDGGENPVGVFIRGSTESGVFGFRGLLALYVPAQNVIALVLYDGENLSGLGTVLTAVAAPFELGDTLELRSSLVSATTYNALVNDTIVISRLIPDADLSITNPCVGVARVASVDEEIEIPEADEGDPVIKTKAADTDRNSTTTITIDADLKFPVLTGETWVFSITVLVKAASGVPDGKYAVLAPAGSTGFWCDVNQSVEVNDLNADGGSFGLTTTPDCIQIEGEVTAGDDGDVGLGWAQNTSSADNSTVMAFSKLIAFKKP